MSTLRAHTGITPITGEFIESRCVVRRRAASEPHSIESFVAIMRREKFSGKIEIEMWQGGVRRIFAEDSQVLDV